MSQITTTSVALQRHEAQAAAAVQAAITELAAATTPREVQAAKTRLQQAEDRFVKADAALHRSQARKSPLGVMQPQLSASYYQEVARRHLATLERSGFAPSTSQVACPHYATPEARQRAAIGGLLGQVQTLNSQLQALMRRLASSATATGATAAGGDTELTRILDDPTLGIEDKIALFMAKYVERNNQEIDQKLRELAAAKTGTKQAASTTKKGGGWFSGIKSFFKKLGRALPKIAGTVIGGMYGGPAGAALGYKLGGAVGKAIGGSSASGATSATTASANGAAKDTTTLETELQRLMQKREQLVKTLTDLMATMHRTSMAVANNLKP